LKTKFAIAFYYIAIGLLVVCAAVIVVKLIFWPPCTQIGNTCVIDPWSTAGLAGTVLAVAATVLAILGAVSVAAWWTSLNTTVTERVKKLYKKQQREVTSQVDTLLAEQEKKVNVQLTEFQTSLVTVRNEMRRIQGLTEQVNEIAIQSLTRSEQQEDQIRQSDRRVADVLAQMQALLVEAQHREVELVDVNTKYKNYLRELEYLQEALRQKFESSGVTSEQLQAFFQEWRLKGHVEDDAAKKPAKADNTNSTPNSEDKKPLT
jgi:hypothetical protein